MIDLITGHQGVAHISAEQVSTINHAMMNGYGQDTIVRLLNGTVSMDSLSVVVNTGFWRANGYDMEITDEETIYIDPSSTGTSRIDVIYIELLQDTASGVQRIEFVTVQGEEAVTPTEPLAPAAPALTTDLLVLALPVVKCTVSESVMTIEDLTIPYDIAAGTNEFVGTQAEWTALTSDEKAEYDGCVVNLTDQTNSVYVYDADTDTLTLFAGNPTAATTAAASAQTSANTALGYIQNSSDAYSTSTAYSVGDYVIYNNTLYKCTTACSAGSWSTNSGCFTQDTLTNAVSSLNNDLNELQRLPQQITYDATKLASAVAEQNLEKYGYVIGDWWTDSNDYKYVLADLDTWYGGYSSYAILDYHHIAIVVITNQTSIWGSSTNSGYNGSTVQSYLQGTVLPKVKASLGSSHIGSHQKLFTTALSSWDWQTGKEISALTEIQVNGSKVWSLDGYQNGEGDRQLEVFRRYHYTIVWGQQHVWGRSLSSASNACAWNSNGLASYNGLSVSRGVVGLIIWH